MVRINNFLNSSWQLIGCIEIDSNEYIVLAHDPDSPTPYATWLGYLKSTGFDCESGNYFGSKEDAVIDMVERAGYGF